MPVTTDRIREARQWALRRYQHWKRQILVADYISRDQWQVIHDDDTVQDSEPLVENLYKQALEDKMGTAASIEPMLHTFPTRGTRSDVGEESAARRRRIFLSYLQRSEASPHRLRMKSYRDWFHMGAIYKIPWTDWQETPRLPYMLRFDPRGSYPLAWDSRGRLTEFMTVNQRPLHELRQELGADHPAFANLQAMRSGRQYDYDRDYLEEIWYFDSTQWARALVDNGMPQRYQGALLVPNEYVETSTVGKELVAWVTPPEPHRMSKCPVEGIHRITEDDDFPSGALVDTIPQLKIANNFMHKLLTDLGMNIFAPVVIEGVTNPEEYGPGAVLLGDGTGNASINRDRPNVNFEAQQTVRQIMEQVRNQAFQPQQRGGQIGASIASDRAVNSVQAQFNEELSWAQSDHETLMTNTLSMTAEFDVVHCSAFADGKPVLKEASGDDGMTAFVEEYDPDDVFGGDYRLQFTYGPRRGLDLQQHLTAISLMKSQLGMSNRSFMQRSGMVPDVLQEERDMAIEALIGPSGLFFGQVLPQQILGGNLQAIVDLVEMIDEDKVSIRDAIFKVIKESLAPVSPEGGALPGQGTPDDMLRRVASLAGGGFPGNAEGQPPLPGQQLSNVLPSREGRLAEAV